MCSGETMLGWLRSLLKPVPMTLPPLTIIAPCLYLESDLDARYLATERKAFSRLLSIRIGILQLQHP